MGVDSDVLNSMIARVNAILFAFRPGEQHVGIAELGRRTGLAKSTVSRIVNELVEQRLLERGPRGVQLGIRIFELGQRATSVRDLRKLAIAHMADLRNALNLTVHLAVLEQSEVVYIEVLSARDGPRLPSQVGGRMPAHATGVGKVLLAASDDSVSEAAINGGLGKVGPETITDPEKLRHALARIRETGVAYESQESQVGVACAAAAVLTSSGEPLAAISAAGWVGDFDPARVGPAVRTAALALSRQVANRPGLRF
jgi:IclR family acetate operon transcriptional repressor